jgi:hypothetical protein
MQKFLVPNGFECLAPFREFLTSVSEHTVAVVAKLIKISSSACLHPIHHTRNQALIAVQKLLDHTLEQADRNGVMFFAEQVIADFNEFLKSPFSSILSVRPCSGAS